jgi:penicillin-binding protein 1C
MAGGRWWRWAAGGAGALLGALVGGALTLDALFPPPLERLRDVSVTVTDRAGAPLRVFTNAAGAWRLPATAEDAAPLFVDLLLAYEDRRFFAHPGVDPLAVVRAAVQNLTAGRVVSGASTLTMQVARLLEPRPRTLAAKIAEGLRALQLEWRYGKRDILGMYLTLAPYGGNVEGVRAASLGLFGKPPRHLTAGEAALLVALPQSPTHLRPDRAPERARAARDKVLERAVTAGLLDRRAAAEAGAEPIPTERIAMPAHAPHLAEALKAQHRADSPGRPVLRTTIDGAIQRTLEDLARRELPGLHERAGLALLVVENRTREVVAYVGSPDPLDERRLGPIDMVRAVRSPGSALKPFIYGLGFDDGVIHPLTRVADVSTRFGDYAPRNFDRDFNGELTVREALQRSLNVPAVLVLDRVGPVRFAEALRRAGTRLVMPAGTVQPGLPVALGGASVSLWSMAGLYVGLAHGGMTAPLRVDADAEAGGAEARLLSPAAALQVLGILEGTPPPAGVVQDSEVRRDGPIALKTGTSYGFRDAWAFGVTERYTVGVWAGRPDGTPSPDHYGRNTAAPMLYRVFDRLPKERGRAFAAAPGAAPALLRRLTAGDPTAIPEPDRLRLTFPTSSMVLEALDPNGRPGPLTFSAAGGRRPLSWLVDGRRIAVSPLRRDAVWLPEGPGFVRITVVDADGRSDSAMVEIR